MYKPEEAYTAKNRAGELLSEAKADKGTNMTAAISSSVDTERNGTTAVEEEEELYSECKTYSKDA